MITVADHHWRASNENPDFIRRYVFPGGQVPAPMVLRGLVRRTGLDWVAERAFGASYARTLRSWRERFEANWDSVIAPMGFDERFHRMWRYYLAYCEGGFRAGAPTCGRSSSHALEACPPNGRQLRTQRRTPSGRQLPRHVATEQGPER